MTEDRGEQDKQQARVSVHADGGLMQSSVGMGTETRYLIGLGAKL